MKKTEQNISRNPYFTINQPNWVIFQLMSEFRIRINLQLIPQDFLDKLLSNYTVFQRMKLSHIKLLNVFKRKHSYGVLALCLQFGVQSLSYGFIIQSCKFPIKFTIINRQYSIKLITPLWSGRVPLRLIECCFHVS